LVEWPIESEIEYSRDHPVNALFILLDRSKIALDPEWLRSEDGTFVDDTGESLQLPPHPAYSPAEQMAAYGLWLVYVHARQWGRLAYMDEQAQAELLETSGVTIEEVREHTAACLLYGYQAVLFAYRLERGEGPTMQEQVGFATVNFAHLGTKGAAVRHGPMNKLKEWAVSRYSSREWKSANDAAYNLSAEIVEYGRTIGATLSPSNAQRTIAEWFRKHDKESRPGG
jgi:hypothetical protein